MIDILLRFVKAERTSDWQLHLSTVREMLPYFAASGHRAYLQSSVEYLNFMSDLSETSKTVYDAFLQGKHAPRRSDRFWAGLSTDY